MFLLLVVFNIVSIGSVWYFHVNRPPENRPPKEGHPEIIQHFLQSEVGLTEEQAKQFRDTRKRYADLSKRYFQDIAQLKFELVNESMTADPDSLKVEQFLQTMGDNQRELELLLYNQFQDLYNICRPDQQERFKKLIGELLEMTGPPMHPDSGTPGPPRERPPQI